MTGTDVVWSNSAAPQKIRSMPMGGGAITDLVTGYGPVEMTNDGQSLFFTTRTAYDPCFCTDNSSTPIYGLGLGGGSPTVINPNVNAQAFPGWPGLVVTGNFVNRISWQSTDAYSPVIGQDKTNTAVLSGAGDHVVINGNSELFFAGKYLVKNSNDDMAMFVTLQTSGTAFVKLESGVGATLISLAPSGLIVRGIAIDTTTLYVIGRFGANMEDQLMSFPLSGGAETLVLDNMYNASNILVDATHVYWSIDGTKVGLGSPTVAPMIVRFAK